MDFFFFLNWCSWISVKLEYVECVWVHPSAAAWVLHANSDEHDEVVCAGGGKKKHYAYEDDLESGTVTVNRKRCHAMSFFYHQKIAIPGQT